MNWYKIVGSRLVTRYWPAVIVGWLALAAFLYGIAPDWDSIAADGDLSFLPPTVASAVGQKTLDQAFPGSRVRSQMVVVIANQHQPLATSDLAVGMELARRLHFYAAHFAWTSIAKELPGVSDTPVNEAELPRGTQTLIETMRDNVNQSIEIDQELATYLESAQPTRAVSRLTAAYELRQRLNLALGRAIEVAQDVEVLDQLRVQSVPSISREPPDWAKAVQDVWTWRDSILGHKLGSEHLNARLIAIQLGNEFSAVGNIDVLEGLEQTIDGIRKDFSGQLTPDLMIEVSGSAALGADMLRASAGSVRLTEGVSIFLVLLILAVAYRGPFLVAIPLATIGLSLVVATAIVALLARDPNVPGSVGLGVFTTTRIFVVVLLFGSGTDFCLFLIARCREAFVEQSIRSRSQLYRAIARSWSSVHNALVASAMTTILGLAVMWFSSFEKFQYSGPVIAISLAVTLVACLSFTPALLSGFGLVAFWPSKFGHTRLKGEPSRMTTSIWYKLWDKVGEIVVARPALTLVLTILLLGIPATYGAICMDRVTYDLPAELSEDAPSRRGAHLISQFFPTSDSSPVTILMIREQPFDSDQQLLNACLEISKSLYTSGVNSVRNVSDPLGDYPPGRRMGLFDKDAWRRRVLQTHRIARDQYISTVEDLGKRLAKFDLILTDNPFSLDAASTLARVLKLLDVETKRDGSPWKSATIAAAGTTVGITDLRMVTQADQRRIQVLVTLVVWAVLIVLLGELLVSTYLILTVLFSYFSTLGLTYFFFSILHGGDYSGLDWKVPLFLFVILVAVGQDYNVYLTTRIREEERRLGTLAGVRQAMVMTGGIITSCGFVMAGTFIAMVSPAIIHWVTHLWPQLSLTYDAPVLSGITELGFALSLGVMLDTLIIRSLLVPAFFVLLRPSSKAS